MQLNSKEQRKLSRRLAAARNSQPSREGFAGVAEAAEVQGRDGRGCPNFALLLSQGSTKDVAHQEMMRRARIKV